MKLQSLYNEYLNIKFNRGLPSAAPTDGFEYSLCEDGSAELFFVGHEEESFSEWAGELQSRDPNYTANPDWEPVLSAFYKQLDVYDEQILYYLLFTINRTMSIIKINPYNAMNDFMKNYCFFQLSQLTHITRLNKEQKDSLRDFFFFFYLYAHPVNEETLYSFSFLGHDLVHTKTNIWMEHYFTAYHDYYRDHFDKYKDSLFIAPQEINACKKLTLELLHSIEGKSPKLTMPPEEGLEDVLQLINDVNAFLQMHSEDKTKLFGIMRDFLSSNRSTPYHDHCFRTLLQNYVTYILYFQFEDIHDLVDYFKDTPPGCKSAINKIFTDAIFIQKIMRQNRIDIAEYENIIEIFDEEARRIYL
ncbi:hypothetical protein [Paenibacillus sp. OAS669]|uniref:hypothetical protein n=1 Tax=Paenibacillus sp. OAS669 TaxID=2663821 RepID=UPI00178B5FB6|nr:hypothetical protein [Paenibacillus sp. OAS669]MBE1443788.1 hypothetical protein [Paenibacillus sp. OAS669]